MPNSIEIFQNTLLKLVVRQGSDSDRRNILLDSGELGYTTDNKRLFVGDGSTDGGVITGNKYLGEGDPTSFTEAEVGDLVFWDSTNNLYKYSGTLVTDINNWKIIGSAISEGDNTITISSNNDIAVGTLSAGNFSADALGNSLYIDSNNRVALSGSGIKTNRIESYDQDYLKLPQKININNVNYKWPSGGLQTDYSLTTDLYGNLSWKVPSQYSTFFVGTSSARIPVGTIIPFLSGGDVPSGWLLCDGQSVLGTEYPDLSSAIGTTYGGSGGSFNVPDLANKTLYGVDGDPSSSTLISLASGSNVSLSANPVNFIIKSIGDNLVSSSLTVNDSLTATVGGVDVTDTTVTTLTGDIAIGMPVLIDSQVVNNSFTVDAYGRVIEVSDTMAGAVSSIQTSEVINPESHVKFLKTPVEVYAATAATTTTEKIQVYPYMASGPYGLPLNAKSVLLDTVVTTGINTNDNPVLVCAAANVGLLHPTPATPTVHTTEYLVAGARYTLYGSSALTTTQTMVPLSSNNVDDVFFGLRVFMPSSASNPPTCSVRIIGYTL